MYQNVREDSGWSRRRPPPTTIAAPVCRRESAWVPETPESGLPALTHLHAAACTCNIKDELTVSGPGASHTRRASRNDDDRWPPCRRPSLRLALRSGDRG